MFAHNLRKFGFGVKHGFKDAGRKMASPFVNAWRWTDDHPFLFGAGLGGAAALASYNGGAETLEERMDEISNDDSPDYVKQLAILKAIRELPQAQGGLGGS